VRQKVLKHKTTRVFYHTVPSSIRIRRGTPFSPLQPPVSTFSRSTLTPSDKKSCIGDLDFRTAREGGVSFGGREPNEKRSSLPTESSLSLVQSVRSPKTALHLDQNLRSQLQFTAISRDCFNAGHGAWHHCAVYGEYTAIPLRRVIPTMCRYTRWPMDFARKQLEKYGWSEGIRSDYWRILAQFYSLTLQARVWVERKMA
jgi:hypothetical protein